MALSKKIRALIALCAAIAVTSALLATDPTKESASSQPASAPASAPASEIPSAPAESWPSFRGTPSMSGVSAGEALPSPLQVVWRFDMGEAVSSTAAVAAGKVFIAGEMGRVVALHTTNGQLIWERKLESGFDCAPAVSDGQVFLGDLDGILRCLSAETGETIWRYASDAEIHSGVTRVGDKVLFGSYDGNLHCVESRSGDLIWTAVTDGPVHSAPAVWKNTAFVAGCDQFVRAINIDTGKEISQFDMGSITAGTASVLDGRLFVGHDAGEIICLDWRNADLVWAYSNPERTVAFFSSPAIAGDCIVAGGRDRTIVCLDRATGEKRWLVPAKSPVDSSAAIAGGRVYIGSDGGALHVIDLADGSVVEKFEAGGAISASPAIASGVLVIGTEDGDVFCLGQKD